jgi:hypothetical protein
VWEQIPERLGDVGVHMAAVVQNRVERPELINDGLQELGVDLTANPNVDLPYWVVELLGTVRTTVDLILV